MDGTGLESGYFPPPSMHRKAPPGPPFQFFCFDGKSGFGRRYVKIFEQSEFNRELGGRGGWWWYFRFVVVRGRTFETASVVRVESRNRLRFASGHDWSSACTVGPAAALHVRPVQAGAAKGGTTAAVRPLPPLLALFSGPRKGPSRLNFGRDGGQTHCRKLQWRRGRRLTSRLPFPHLSHPLVGPGRVFGPLNSWAR